MKGISIQAVGGPEVLEWVDLAEPVPGPKDIIVEVHAAGLNYIDTYHRSGLYPVPLPFTPGMEGSGIVVAAGPECVRFRPGDRVAWSANLGSYAELARVAEDSAVSVPPGVPLDLAAAVLLQGMTAHYLVTDTFRLGAGNKCLVHAGAGGTGLLLIQMAKHLGAEVFTTVGSAEKVALVEQAGADHVILYRDEDFVDAIERIAGPKAIDVVYDGVGKTTFDRSLDCIRPRGMMATFGNASGPADPVSPLRLMQCGSLFLTRPNLTHYIATRDEFERRAGDLYSWIAAGWLKVQVGERLPLAGAAEAHRLLQGRGTTGKVLLIPPGR
jgi:NADPH2:quinone reductase